MSKINQLVRPNILKMKPYSSARDEYSDVSDAILLDANENPFQNGLNRYPDPYQSQLKAEIGKVKDIITQHIFLGNGSDEAIDLIFRIFCEPGIDNVIAPDPTYGMYQVSAAIQHIEVRKSPLTNEFHLDTNAVLNLANDQTKILFLCSPNNPSGNNLHRKDIVKLIEQFKGIVVIDEAYIDFTDESSFIEMINNYDNLIVLQTFSKAWGLAGLRLGMAFSNSLIINLFNKVKAPYNLSVSTQSIALEHLQNKEKVVQKIEEIVSERKKLEHELKSLTSVEKIFKSDTNFILVRFKDHQRVFKTLTENGIIVRDRSKALHCDRSLRLTVGTKEENNQLIKILKEI